MGLFVIGKSAHGSPLALELRMANRHGLIAGATGTGKTVTLQVLAEQFSRAGVPVFLADIKGDLSGLAKSATLTEKLEARVAQLQLADYQPQRVPILFWDLFGSMGHPIRTTVSEVGPVLFSRLLQLNDTQSAVLQIAFRVADDHGLLLLDLKDLRALVAFLGEQAKELQTTYGNIAPTTIAAIQRGLVSLEEAGGDRFFGEPALKIEHLMQTDFSGQGVVSILDATRLVLDSRLYATFLLWLLSELFEELPEVGDLEKPKLVFFFDEAHLLFQDAPPSLVQKIEQVVRLIRSKGVGVYFVTQNPLDIPAAVLAQLGNRVQHALRAFTPQDQKAVRAAAATFRPNPELSTEAEITTLRVGEALVSLLDATGAPSVVEKAMILPPRSQIGVIGDDERRAVLNLSPLKSIYEQSIDRDSAFELLQARAANRQPTPSESAPASQGVLQDMLFGTGRRQGAVEAMTKSAFRSVGSSIGRAIVRGIMGAITGSSRSGR